MLENMLEVSLYFWICEWRWPLRRLSAPCWTLILSYLFVHGSVRLALPCQPAVRTKGTYPSR